MSSSFKSWLNKLLGVPTKTEVKYINPKLSFQEPEGSKELPAADFTGMVHLGIIVGHSASDGGAVMPSPYGVSEYEYGNQVADLVEKIAKQSYPQVKVAVITRDHVGIAGAYEKARNLLCDVVIELHFNAFDKNSVGTETLCTADGTDMDFAHIIHGQLCTAFLRTGHSRGVRAISKSIDGGINVHSFQGGANCLVEPFFGDNVKEAVFAMANKEAYAAALLRGVFIWAKSNDMVR